MGRYDFGFIQYFLAFLDEQIWFGYVEQMGGYDKIFI